MATGEEFHVLMTPGSFEGKFSFCFISALMKRAIKSTLKRKRYHCRGRSNEINVYIGHGNDGGKQG